MSGLKVYNRGISGDTADRLLERLDDNLINIKPSVVVLLIGINDISHKYVDMDYILTNTRAIIDKIAKALPQTKIIVQNVYPINEQMCPRLKGVNTK